MLDSAAHVFAEEGYAASSVDQITGRVGMSRRTFYDHFADLKNIFGSVYDRGADVIFDRVEAAVLGERDPRRRLWQGVSAYLSAMREHAALARVLYQHARSAGPDLARRQETMRKRYVALWRGGFQQAFDAGIARRCPDERIVYALVTGVESVALRYIDAGEEDRMLEARLALVDLITCVTLHSDEDIAQLLSGSRGDEERPIRRPGRK